MKRTIRNTVANFLGGLTTLGLVLVFNALYFRVAAEEVFGLVSILLTVQLTAPALDLGTGRVATRLMAEGLALEQDPVPLRRAIATVGACNLAVAIMLGIALMLAAPAVAEGWLKARTLTAGQVTTGIMLIAACLALIMLRNFSTSCLYGMKRHVTANILLAAFTLMRGIAGVAALRVQPDDPALFLWSQIIVHGVEAALATAVVWHRMPSAPGWPRLDPGVIASNWRFAAGDGGAVMIGICLVHGDKLLLSALLPLSSYGAYALISTIAGGIMRFTSPFAAAFLPHFVELWVRDARDELRADYLAATQLVSVVIVPIAAAMVAFAPEIVAAVLGPGLPSDPLAAAFAVLTAATVLGNLMYLPHGVQLAAGNAITALRFTAVNAAIYLALIVVATPWLGILGPAVSLFVVYALAIGLFTRVSNRMLGLSGATWFWRATLRPGLPAIGVVLAARLVTPPGIGLVAGLIWLALVTLLAMGAALTTAPRARRAIAQLRVPEAPPS